MPDAVFSQFASSVTYFVFVTKQDSMTIYGITLETPLFPGGIGS